MVKLSTNIVIAIIGLTLIVGFIAFLSLPKNVPQSHRLSTERLVKLAEVSQIAFASPEESLAELTVDAIACPTGEIVASEEECPGELELLEEETINCDGTIEDPVCTEAGVTYLNPCFAEEAGSVYFPGMCEETGELLIEEYFNETDANETTSPLKQIEELIITGIPAKCNLTIHTVNGTENAEISIKGDDFEYKGAYLDDSENLLQLNLIQSKEKLIFYEPDTKKWLAVRAKLAITDIPIISRNLQNAQGGDSPDFQCKAQPLSTELITEPPGVEETSITKLLSRVSGKSSRRGAPSTVK